jgi:hypothetical protein
MALAEQHPRKRRNEGVCSSCGADLIWAVTERGRRMPLTKTSERRRWIIEPDTGIGRTVLTYESHWADCPHADQHRNER